MKLEKRRDKEATRKKLRIVGGERRLGSLSFSPLLVSFRFVSLTGARRGARRAAFECLHYRWLKGGDARSKKEESRVVAGSFLRCGAKVRANTRVHAKGARPTSKRE